ncbi:hypothetical protein TNCV_1944091 [Trichonephila clavipes]|nr:hypothetical protein TNCV_1944091 [Trichonephila clavipes]
MISDQTQFNLSYTTGETKIQHISREKRRKHAVVLEKARNRDYTGMWVRLGSTDLMAGKVVFLRGLLSPIRVVDLTVMNP